MRRKIRLHLKREFEGKIPYSELVQLESELLVYCGVKSVLETLSGADEDKVEQIVNKVLKSKKYDDLFIKNSKSMLTQLFKQLYTRRSLWKDGLSLNSD